MSAERASDVATHALNPGTYMVDTLPILEHLPAWFPGAGFKRKAREWNRLYIEMNHSAIRDRQEADGRSHPSSKIYEVRHSRENFLKDRRNSTVLHLSRMELTKLHEDPHGCGYTEQELMHTAGTMYETGTDTTYTALLSFVLAMTLFPEAQHKAQDEIDRVVGQGRLPEFRDRQSLVYVEAVLLEVQRWQPIAPAGVPHYIHVEDEYRGYRIPKNTTVIENIWAILHDEKMYPDPYAFKPERWIKDGKINPAIRDITSGFGFGRRICPGRYLAMSTMYITAASILAAFEISKEVDENGEVIEPKVEFISNIQK
ncbi:hypothetical protein AAF712_006740 [Marasmius tenuissimus]|uniref:Cytochrome P450 n=1 Tax=Marasmius tenuissimus TaxID=585030 RepID=A0ABR2ZZV0_9AGAR